MAKKSREIALSAMRMPVLGAAVMSVAVAAAAVPAETPPEIKAIESRAAAYARLTPAERRDMWDGIKRAASELVLDDRSDVSYPDAFQFPDGAIGLTYDRRRGSDAEILFARFTKEAVLAGEIRSKGSFLRSVIVSARLEREKAGRGAK